jgi:hypothetical protein
MVDASRGRATATQPEMNAFYKSLAAYRLEAVTVEPRYVIDTATSVPGVQFGDGKMLAAGDRVRRMRGVIIAELGRLRVRELGTHEAHLVAARGRKGLFVPTGHARWR